MIEGLIKPPTYTCSKNIASCGKVLKKILIQNGTLAAERKKTMLFLNNTSTVFTLIVFSFSAHKNLVESDSEALMLHFTIFAEANAFKS